MYKKNGTLSFGELAQMVPLTAYNYYLPLLKIEHSLKNVNFMFHGLN